jgi:hypothetical protein
MRTFIFAVLLAAAVAPAQAAVLALAEQGGVRVELTDEACTVKFALEQVAEAKKVSGLEFETPKAARYIEDGKASAGCWLFHPQAPAVIMLWEDETSGVAPVQAFQPAK